MNPDLLLSLDGAAAANPLTSMIFPLVMVGAVFYFFVFRPNQKEEAARKELISGLQKADIRLDRKQLSELAIHQPEAFKDVIERAKAALAA